MRKAIYPAWEVAVWRNHSLERIEEFGTENRALQFARAAKDDMRVLTVSCKVEGLTGKSVPARRFGDPKHSYFGTAKAAD